MSKNKHKTTKKSKNVLDIYRQDIFSIPNLIVIITDNIAGLKYDFVDYQGSKIDFTDENLNNPGLTFFGYSYKDEGCILVVINPAQLGPSLSITNVIAHESSHVAHHLMDYNSIPLSDDTTEVYANVTGWAADCVTKSYNKWIKK